MGVVSSKSPLERRNTVLRRSQRKSIHRTKSKLDKIIRDIKKLKATEEDSDFIELKAKIETAEKELKIQSKNLQPQVRNIHNESLKKIQQCYELLEEKLKENQAKLQVKQTEKKEQKVEQDDHDDDDDVFVEELNEDESNKRDTVQLNVVQLEAIEGSPQINKRFSALKIGVPVMPGSMVESLRRKSQEVHVKHEEQLSNLRKKIEALEIEISGFVGQKRGKYYNKIKNQLDAFSEELSGISTSDDDIIEQIKSCKTYIASCLSFLDEKAVDESFDDDEEFFEAKELVMNNVETNLSPRSMRTTYI